MSVRTERFTVRTHGKKTYEITDQVSAVLLASGLRDGTVTVFVRHTSCSLVIMENADHSARTDLHALFERLVPEDSPYFLHTCEGDNDIYFPMQNELKISPSSSSTSARPEISPTASIASLRSSATYSADNPPVSAASAASSRYFARKRHAR